MITKIKEILTAILVSAAFLVPVAVPAAVSAATEIEGGLCTGAELKFDANGEGDCSGSEDASNKLNDIIKTTINVVSVIVGVVAVVMIIFGGLKYITSGGDSGNVSSAKNTIIYAIVGLVVVALAQFIVKFVLDKAVNGNGGGN